MRALEGVIRELHGIEELKLGVIPIESCSYIRYIEGYYIIVELWS